MKILGLIPARAGSKGVPAKNSKLLMGQSLVERALQTAQASGVVDQILVSTDDFEVIRQVESSGIGEILIRPAALADDRTPMIDVVQHALNVLSERNQWPTAVMLLQPTSPLRTPEHLRAAVSLLNEADSVCSVVPLPLTQCPHYVMKVEDGVLRHFLPEGASIQRRQDVPQAYVREGTVYLTRRSVLVESRSFYGDRCAPLVLDPHDSLSIDTQSDWEEAERRLAQREVAAA